MGKDLKGKELGVGICQTKDKKYVARITTRNGKRVKRVFDKLVDCRKWIAEARYNEEHGSISVLSDMSVDAWYEYWITEIKAKTVRFNTIRNHNERYKQNIKEYIGHMPLNEVKPIHCQNVLNRMTDTYRNSTIKMTSITMYGMFQSAVDNELILKNPMTKYVRCTSGKPSKPPRVLSVEEQKLFLETTKESSNYNQYAFLLQTGLRTGEMIGLKWSDIDFEKRILHVSRTMEYRYSVGEWRIGETKTKNGCRDIPLTTEAIEILKRQKKKVQELKTVKMEFSDFVFLSRKGEPTKNSAYDTKLMYYCDKVGMQRFSMHTLRHTFATSFILGGGDLAFLRIYMGHSSIETTQKYLHLANNMRFLKNVYPVDPCFLKKIY